MERNYITGQTFLVSNQQIDGVLIGSRMARNSGETNETEAASAAY